MSGHLVCYITAHKYRDIVRLLWHTPPRRSCHGSPTVAVAPQDLGPFAAPEEGGGARGRLPGGQAFASRPSEFRRPDQRRVGGNSQVAALQGVGVVVPLPSVRSRGSPGGVSVGPTTPVA